MLRHTSGFLKSSESRTSEGRNASNNAQNFTGANGGSRGVTIFNYIPCFLSFRLFKIIFSDTLDLKNVEENLLNLPCRL